MNTATLYRDSTYGALSICEGRYPGTLVTIDHGLDEADFEAVLAVLETRGRADPKGDGVCEWELRAHHAEVMSSINSALRARGYGDDRLGEKAIIRMTADEAAKPDLPGGVPMTHLPEGVRSGLLALSALVERACGLSESRRSANFYPRHNRLDALSTPLPFLRVQVEGKAIDPTTIQQDVRQAFSQTEGLVRVSAKRGDAGTVVLEAAFALPQNVLESYEARKPPKFDQTDAAYVREARWALSKPLPVEVAEDLTKRATESGCALETTVTERSFRALLPCTQVVNEGLSSRIRWLNNQLQPWGASFAETGELCEAGAVNCPGE